MVLNYGHFCIKTWSSLEAGVRALKQDQTPGLEKILVVIFILYGGLFVTRILISRSAQFATKFFYLRMTIYNSFNFASIYMYIYKKMCYTVSSNNSVVWTVEIRPLQNHHVCGLPGSFSPTIVNHSYIYGGHEP